MSTHRCDRVDELRRLTPLVLDQTRADAVRLRCGAELARRARRSQRPDSIAPALVRAIGPVMLGTVSVVYATALIAVTLRIERWLR